MSNPRRDSLLYRGHRLALAECPLEAYWERPRGLLRWHRPARPDFDWPDSTLDRGYVADWAIEDGRLLLVALSSAFVRVPSPTRTAPMDSIYAAAARLESRFLGEQTTHVDRSSVAKMLGTLAVDGAPASSAAAKRPSPVTAAGRGELTLEDLIVRGEGPAADPRAGASVLLDMLERVHPAHTVGHLTATELIDLPRHADPRLKACSVHDLFPSEPLPVVAAWVSGTLHGSPAARARPCMALTIRNGRLKSEHVFTDDAAEARYGEA